MRKRARAGTHHVRVYKFRAWLKGWENPFRLPDAIFDLAKREGAYWNALCVEFDRRSKEWMAAHPVTEEKSQSEKEGKAVYWKSFDTWAREQQKAFELNWECGPEVLDRFHATLRRMKDGGGAPKPAHFFDSFSIPHRYTGGGIEWWRLSGSRARRFHIAKLDGLAFASNCREARRMRIAEASFGIGTEGIPLRIVAHRQIDDEAIVKRASLVGRRQKALGWEISVAVTVEEQKPPAISRPGRAGIDVGWRKIGDRLRVAVVYDGRRHDELHIPLSFETKDLGVVGVQRIEDLQAFRDSQLERCRAILKTILPELPHGFAQMRNRGLTLMLEDGNLPQTARSEIEKWLADDRRLAHKRQMIENRLLARREHIYRNWAADLVKRFGVIRIEQINLHEMYARKNQTQEALKAAARYRKYASCGTLLAFIKNAARFHGNDLQMVEAAYTTATCGQCGEPFESGEQLPGVCTAGHRMDQDWNAAMVIFANPPALQAKQGFAKNGEENSGAVA